MKNINYISKICTIIAVFSLSLTVSAENSKITPEEERLADTLEPISESTEKFIEYLEELDQEYPDSAKVDTTKFMEKHGENLALLYCNAIGIDEPCVLRKNEDDPSKSTYEPLSLERETVLKNEKKVWWSWLWNHTYNVGVIPQSPNWCSPPPPHNLGTPVSIKMDDEDRSNANDRSGWIGATKSTRNTTWNFCRLDRQTSLQFGSLASIGDEYNYSVISFGFLCPSGAHRVIRYQENEMHNNNNSSSGDIFPNFRQREFLVKKLWVTHYCEFDGGNGNMYQFPNLGFPYGVFAHKNLPNALVHGSVKQDDEDWWNQNRWRGSSSPHGTMGGGRNTWRDLAKVRN